MASRWSEKGQSSISQIQGRDRGSTHVYKEEEDVEAQQGTKACKARVWCSRHLSTSNQLNARYPSATCNSARGERDPDDTL